VCFSFHDEHLSEKQDSRLSPTLEKIQSRRQQPIPSGPIPYKKIVTRNSTTSLRRDAVESPTLFAHSVSPHLRIHAFSNAAHHGQLLNTAAEILGAGL